MYFKELSTSDSFFTTQNSFLTKACPDSAFHQSIVSYLPAFSSLQEIVAIVWMIMNFGPSLAVCAAHMSVFISGTMCGFDKGSRKRWRE